MAISQTAKQIGIRLVDCIDGSTVVVTERGEVLSRQCGVTLKSTPGGRTTVIVEFDMDHDKFQMQTPGEMQPSLIKVSGDDLEPHIKRKLDQILEDISTIFRENGK